MKLIKKTNEEVEVKDEQEVIEEEVIEEEDIPKIRDDLNVILSGVNGYKFSYEMKEKAVIPAIFPGFNRAVRIGGFPTGCFILIHGPSQGGKTAFALGAAKSFIDQGHRAIYLDAEHTLNKEFLENFNIPFDIPYFTPFTYEDTVKQVNKIITNYEKGRKSKKIDKNKALLFVVDSINQLIPEEEISSSSVGKGYPLNAIMNTKWIERLNPRVSSLPICFMVIAQEKMMMDAPRYGPDYTIKGGKTLIYASSLIVRVDVEKSIKISKGKDKIEVGRAHKCSIEKSKIGICHEKFKFMVSNGKGGWPIGFDIAQEVLEESKLRGNKSVLIRRPGAVWYHHALPNGKMKGDLDLIKYLRTNQEFLDLVLDELNETARNAIVRVEEVEDEDIDIQ